MRRCEPRQSRNGIGLLTCKPDLPNKKSIRRGATVPFVRLTNRLGFAVMGYAADRKIRLCCRRFVRRQSDRELLVNQVLDSALTPRVPIGNKEAIAVRFHSTPAWRLTSIAFLPTGPTAAVETTTIGCCTLDPSMPALLFAPLVLAFDARDPNNSNNGQGIIEFRGA